MVLSDLKKQNKEFCLSVGIANNALRTWEIRDTDPSAKVILRIADYLGVSVRWLLTGKDEQDLSRDERNLLSYWDRLTEDNRRMLLAWLDMTLTVQDERGEPAQPESGKKDISA
jgi:transcriptional regulator with XRE-family HTH domain